MNTTKHLDRIVYKSIALQVLISLVILTADFLNDFHWIVFIPAIAGALIVSVFEINKQYLIRLDKEGKGNLKIIYYNYLDKILSEHINPDQLSEHKVSKNKKLVTLRFQDNRELKLHCVDGITK